MIREGHPEVIIDRAGRPNPPPSLESIVRVARDLERVHGFVVPSWEALSLGERPAPREPDEFEARWRKARMVTRGCFTS